MQEYSRKAATAESRLEELHKRSVHHDDHLRIIDGWWLQVRSFFDECEERAQGLTIFHTDTGRIGVIG